MLIDTQFFELDLFLSASSTLLHPLTLVYRPRCYWLPPLRPFLFFSLFFFVEFSVSPFQTFFNSGIKGTGGLGRLGYGILQALSENLQIKKALLWFWFGGWWWWWWWWGGEGRSEQARGAGGGVVGRAAAFWAFRKKKGSLDYLRRERRVSCLCFVDVVVDSDPFRSSDPPQLFWLLIPH